MRLAYLVDHWPGLFEAYLLRELQWMRRRGHWVTVLSLGLGGPHGFRKETQDYVDLAEFDLEDIPALQLDARNSSDAQVVRESAKFLRKHEVELIDAHLAREPAEVACQLHLQSGIPFAVRMRGGDVHSNPSPRLAEIVHHASVVCPMSSFLADVLVGKRLLKKVPPGIPVKACPDKLQVMTGCLPSSYLAARPAAQSNDVCVVGAIGRAVPVKRFSDIIHAVAALAPDFPGLQLKIVGGGVLLPELKELAAQNGLSGRFEITGFRKWSEVIQLVRQFHIYVHSGELEGFGMSTVEAGFHGLPLLLSRTGAHEQCVEPGMNGYLFEPGDIPALRENLRKLLLAGPEKRERMGRASIEIVGSQFAEEAVMPKIETAFQRAIRRAHFGTDIFATSQSVIHRPND